MTITDGPMLKGSVPEYFADSSVTGNLEVIDYNTRARRKFPGPQAEFSFARKKAMEVFQRLKEKLDEINRLRLADGNLPYRVYNEHGDSLENHVDTITDALKRYVKATNVLGKMEEKFGPPFVDVHHVKMALTYLQSFAMEIDDYFLRSIKLFKSMSKNTEKTRRWLFWKRDPAQWAMRSYANRLALYRENTAKELLKRGCRILLGFMNEVKVELIVPSEKWDLVTRIQDVAIQWGEWMNVTATQIESRAGERGARKWWYVSRGAGKVTLKKWRKVDRKIAKLHLKVVEVLKQLRHAAPMNPKAVDGGVEACFQTVADTYSTNLDKIRKNHSIDADQGIDHNKLKEKYQYEKIMAERQLRQIEESALYTLEEKAELHALWKVTEKDGAQIYKTITKGIESMEKITKYFGRPGAIPSFWQRVLAFFFGFFVPIGYVRRYTRYSEKFLAEIDRLTEAVSTENCTPANLTSFCAELFERIQEIMLSVSGDRSQLNTLKIALNQWDTIVKIILQCPAFSGDEYEECKKILQDVTRRWGEASPTGQIDRYICSKNKPAWVEDWLGARSSTIDRGYIARLKDSTQQNPFEGHYHRATLVNDDALYEAAQLGKEYQPDKAAQLEETDRPWKVVMRE